MLNKKNNAWNLKTQMLEAIKKRGGFVNCHAHFDKAYFITREGLDKSMVSMEEKWRMSDGIKRDSTGRRYKSAHSKGVRCSGQSRV